ncbi:DUF2960 family protein [Vibrio crassostreae]|jgi:hypothetical protein|uniref:DUF2960 domain-containing protein n=7 Tax=Vibrio TaxID=662 RepID=A0A109D9Y6_9VIBR|nr:MULTISPECIES: DUF2960 family protein [Vibrio]MDD1825502.1 DUF2960 domain-containing protein [Photobacterium sp. ZSDE20]KAA8667088.1 DUF2960 domain-containing protein [Vibrio gigantis]KWU01587.1 hypothetical protein APQ14_05280 [Vibrio toranzoniae]MBE8576605.1 DUF2960 domain-containing protein [Vibrio sp. OPT18]MCC4891010.1 DUF2960 domain-containing protein [Vibrio sp. F13]
MARTILYTYKDEDKELLFSKQEHRTIQEAVAAAEGIDISEYLKTEQQLELISDTKAVRNYQDNYFRKLGFTKLTLKQKDNLGVGKKKK